MQVRESNYDPQMIVRQAQSRMRFLDDLKKICEEALKKAPEGSLRACSHGNYRQYYHRTDPKKRNGVYIPVEKRHLAEQLAQKEYDQKLLKSVEAERTVLSKLLSNYPAVPAEGVFDGFPEAKKELVCPFREPDEAYAEKWNRQEYEGNPFYQTPDGLETDRGEKVRSKSEWIIANLLYRAEVPYRYECPLHLGKAGTVYPDFMVLNVKRREELIWEHLGMMDDPEYAEKSLRKISAYINEGFYPGENLILTAETKQQPLDVRLVKTMINRYCL